MAGRHDFLDAAVRGLQGREQVAFDRHRGADRTQRGRDALGVGLRYAFLERLRRPRKQPLGDVIRHSGDAGELAPDGGQVVVAGGVALQNNTIEHQRVRRAELWWSVRSS